MDAFVRMFNRIYENRQSFIKTMTENIEAIILQRPDIGETEALPEEYIISELQKNAGIQFDPELLKVFIEKVLGQISGL